MRLLILCVLLISCVSTGSGNFSTATAKGLGVAGVIGLLILVGFLGYYYYKARKKYVEKKKKNKIL